MAIFTYIGTTDWNAYSDIVGGIITARTATTFKYTSTTGYVVTLHGTGFSYDASGIPTGGTATGLDVDKAAVHVGNYSGLTTSLTDYVTKSFGLTSGVAGTTATDMGGLYAEMRSGNDVINGNDLRTTFLGYDGNDTFYAGAGNDVMYGGEGFSFFFGGRGLDRYYGGLANDYIYFTDVDATGHGVNVNLSKASGQIIDDGYGNLETATRIDNVVGSNFDDHLTGSKSFNFLWGGLGNDTIYAGGGTTAGDQLDGGEGADVLKGGGGSDVLIGGNGIDTLTGGGGLDFFHIEGAVPGASGADLIMDFQAGLDKIVINSHWAADLPIGTILATQFISGAGVVNATTALQRLIYNSTDGNLYFDSDGTGSANAVLLATLVNHAVLTSDQIGAIEMF